MVSLNRMVRHYPCTALRTGDLPAKQMSDIRRRLPVGAEAQPDGSTHFPVWAPDPRSISSKLDRDAPNEFRLFVDRAHAAGLGVILDVVYNHLGPDGCVLGRYASAYFAKHYANEWGDGLNYDGPRSSHVREYFVSNAAYWIDEFRL